jgi:polyvinyl alcohol dehydrogenase (cytochrome)
MEYLGGPSGIAFNGAESTITPANVGSLTEKWTTTGAGGISAQPIVAGGQIYWGSWDGVLHDTPVSGGADVWHTPLGVTNDPSCPGREGIGSTPLYAVIGGTPTIYVGGGGNDAAVGQGNVYLYALNAATGVILWKTLIGTSPQDFAWSSPVLYNHHVYYGVASFGDCPLTRGRILQVDPATGAIQNTFYTEPPNCTAGGIWGTPTIDASTGMLYTATGTQSSCWGQPGDYSASMLEINANTMQYVASWQIPKGQLVADSDFGSAPTLFSALINGSATKMTGITNKNGIFYAFDRTQIAKGPIWEDQVAVGGASPLAGEGGLSPAAWDGRVLYIPAGNTTINGTSCMSGLRAVNPATGAYLWQDCFPGLLIGAAMGTPGLIFINEGSTVAAVSDGTGAELFSFTDTGARSIFYGPPTVADGHLYTCNMDSTVFAFGL